MAGIRPQARGGALSGIGIAFIVFLVLWVISTTGLVILYTGQAKLQQDLQAAEQEKARIGTAAQVSRFGGAAREGQTILGRIGEERDGLASLVTGQNERDFSSIEKEVADRYAAIKAGGKIDNADLFTTDGSLPLLAAVQNLHDGLAKERDRRIKAETDLKAAQEQVSQLTAARDGAMQQFEQQLAAVDSKLKDTQDQLAAYQKDKDQQVEALEANATKAKDLLSRESERHLGELAEQERQLTQMRARLNDALVTLKAIRGQPDVMAAARQADGKIIRALPSDPNVYINLGARDRLTLGMRFAVYSAAEGIPAGGEGKANIEISTIYDDVAVGKIVSRSGDLPVMEGDLVANAIYDKTRKHRFVVAGAFDLAGTGVPTLEGADRVKAMIQEWGGEVVDRIDTSTDFVVLGYGPSQPVAPGEAASPIDKQRHQKLLDEYEAFQKIEAEAKSLMVPILREGPFLSYVGYNISAMRNGRTQAQR